MDTYNWLVISHACLQRKYLEQAVWVNVSSSNSWAM